MIMLEDSPQPDLNLRVLPEYGGTSWADETHGFLAGKPELLVEVCPSSTAYDLHQKLDLYEEAGIPEFLVVLMQKREIRWHILKNGSYEFLPPGPDGIWRSQQFPGLWVHGEAIFVGNTQQMLATLHEGLGSKEHQDFVARLQKHIGATENEAFGKLPSP